MQKFIRRGMEVEAMEVACEMGHTSKGFATWVLNRLEIISHEDIGLAAPEIIPLVRTCCEQAKAWHKDDYPDGWQMAVGTAIRAMCRAPKSREGDHFQASVALRLQLEGYVPADPGLGVRSPHRVRQSQGARDSILPRGVDEARAGSGGKGPL